MAEDKKNNAGWSWGAPIKEARELFDLLKVQIDLDIAPIKWGGICAAEGVEKVSSWMAERGFCAVSMRDAGYFWMIWDKTLPEVPPSEILPVHAEMLWARMGADAIALELSEIGLCARSEKLARDAARRSL